MQTKHKVLAACTVGNGISSTVMVYTVFGLFLIPISTEFDWPRSVVSSVLLILAVMGAIAYPFIGRTIDRYGPRKVLIPGLIAYGTSVALISTTTANVVHFYAIFAMLGVAAAIPSSAMLTKVIAGWFEKGRGFALGFAGGGGNGVGAAISPIFTAALIAQFGWRGAFVGIACIILALGLPTFLLLLRDPPQHSHGENAVGEGMTLQETLKTPTFWILLAATATGAGCMTAVFAHVVPILVDRGIAMNNAVSVLATFSIVTAIWQIGIGMLLDRLPRPWIAAPFYLLAVLGMFLLSQSDMQFTLFTAGVLMGLGLGTEYGVLPFLLSRYFGVKHYGAISGVAYGVLALIQGLAPVLMDLDYDLNGSYQMALIVISIAMIIGAGLLTRLRPLGLLSSA
ncbi:MAG: MFS transporter [Pseudomonadota bacterium]